MLWLVDPGNPEHAGLPRSREGIPGDPALGVEFQAAAWTNPAKVPVRLVGPSADECADLGRSVEIARFADRLARELLREREGTER